MAASATHDRGRSHLESRASPRNHSCNSHRPAAAGTPAGDAPHHATHGTLATASRRRTAPAGRHHIPTGEPRRSSRLRAASNGSSRSGNAMADTTSAAAARRATSDTLATSNRRGTTPTQHRSTRAKHQHPSSSQLRATTHGRSGRGNSLADGTSTAAHQGDAARKKPQRCMGILCTSLRPGYRPLARGRRGRTPDPARRGTTHSHTHGD